MRDFVFNEKEMAEEKLEYTRLLEEKKTQFVSCFHELFELCYFVSVYSVIFSFAVDRTMHMNINC